MVCHHVYTFCLLNFQLSVSLRNCSPKKKSPYIFSDLEKFTLLDSQVVDRRGSDHASYLLIEKPQCLGLCLLSLQHEFGLRLSPALHFKSG